MVLVSRLPCSSGMLTSSQVPRKVAGLEALYSQLINFVKKNNAPDFIPACSVFSGSDPL